MTVMYLRPFLTQMKNIDNNVLDYVPNIYVNTAKTGGGGLSLINSELGKYLDHER